MADNVTKNFVKSTQWLDFLKQMGMYGIAPGAMQNAKDFQALLDAGFMQGELFQNPLASVTGPMTDPSTDQIHLDAQKQAMIAGFFRDSGYLDGLVSDDTLTQLPVLQNTTEDFFNAQVNNYNTQTGALQDKQSRLVGLVDNAEQDKMKMARQFYLNNPKRMNYVAQNNPEVLDNVFGSREAWTALTGKKGNVTDKSLGEAKPEDFTTDYRPYDNSRLTQTFNPLQQYAQTYPAAATQTAGAAGPVGGTPADVVGERGQEVVRNTSNVPMLVSPATSPLPVAETGSRLVQEDNKTTAQSELMRRAGQGLAEGGVIPPGEERVVGEQGPETVTPAKTGSYAPMALPNLPAPTSNPLSRATEAATMTQLSGAPSTTVNDATTQNFIQKAIADPARKNFQENTLQQIKSSYAGPGYWGSGRANAESKGAGDVESNISSLGAQYAYADEQARRDLAESAANRQAGAIPMSLNVQNNPLLQMQTQAGIANTQAATARTQALTPAELAATQASTERIKTMTPAELAQYQANTQATQSSTQRQQALLPGEVQQQGLQAQYQQYQNESARIVADIAKNTQLTVEQQAMLTTKAMEYQLKGLKGESLKFAVEMMSMLGPETQYLSEYIDTWVESINQLELITGQTGNPTA